MSVEALVKQLQEGPVDFPEVMAVIDANFQFTPTAFGNGDVQNAAGSNNGSCKILAFGQLMGLSEQATLNAFGDFYTQDVLANPTGSDHANIRNFMRSGWQAVKFDGMALAPK